MNAFLSHDWAGIPIALIVTAIGLVVFRFGRTANGKVLRVTGVLLGGLVLVISLVFLGGSLLHVYRVQQIVADYPPPGEVFQVDGRAMHMMRAGEHRYHSGGRTPTVIFIGGGYSQGLTMHHLFRELSRDTRTIIFDRAGTGWSDWSPEPRHVRNDVEDLKRLLDAVGEQGPFILSGHSWGGLFSLNFAGVYPDETAGVVALDATPPEMLLGPMGQSLVAFGGYLKISALLGLFSLDGLLPSLGGEMMNPESEAFIYGPILDVWDMATARMKLAKLGIAGSQSFAAMLADPESQVKNPGDLGDIPLIALYQKDLTGMDGLPEAERREMIHGGAKMMGVSEEDYEKLLSSMQGVQQRLADLSSEGRLVYAPEGSTHQFPYEHPEFCATHIRKMIAMTLVSER